MSLKTEITKNFTEIGLELKDEIINKCIELCSVYGIDATELVETWMAFTITNSLGSVPTLDGLSEMERKELSKRKRITQTPKQIESVKIYNAPTNRVDDVVDIYTGTEKENYVQTPKTPRIAGSKIDQGTPSRLKTPRLLFSPASYSPESIAGSTKYSARLNSSSVVCSFGNATSSTWKSNLQYAASVRPVEEFSLVPNDALYMFDKLSKRRSVLCEQTIHVAGELIKRHNLDTPTDLTELAPELVTYVGRVCSDNDFKLNASSVLLEYTPNEALSGECVELDLSGVPNYSLFPGQIIALNGKNPTTKKIFAEGPIYTDASPSPYQEPNELQNLNESLQIVISVGPYTPSDTLSYEPIEDLFRYVCDHKPHILIIVGPIVDASHPLIVQGGKLAETFAQCYDRILKKIIQPLSKSHTKVIVISSWREAGYHVIYPTPASPSSLPNQFPNLLILPDPSVFTVNGLCVGVTSTDILMHLGKEEISHFSDASIKTDRLRRLASYIIQQKHFYPLMPPDDEMSVDFQLWWKYGRLSVTPHILIVPSDLHFFMKVTHNCLVINPERLTKGNVGGNFVRLEVRPKILDEVWSVETHINAEILKI